MEKINRFAFHRHVGG